MSRGSVMWVPLNVRIQSPVARAGTVRVPGFSGAEPSVGSVERELRTALRENRVATVKIDTQRKYMTEQYRKLWNVEEVYGRINHTLVEYGQACRMPAIEVLFIDVRSPDLKPDQEAAQNIEEAMLPLPRTAVTAAQQGIFVLPSRSRKEVRNTKDVPSPETIRELADTGHPILLEKNHHNLMKHAKRSVKTVLRYLAGRFRPQALKPQTPFIRNRRNRQFFENLRRSGIDTIVLYGVYTDYCVKAALGELKQMGFKMIVLEDATLPKQEDLLQHPYATLGRLRRVDGSLCYPYAGVKTINSRQFLAACQSINQT